MSALIDLVGENCKPQCIERTARKQHTCHTHTRATDNDGPQWAKDVHSTCKQLIQPGDIYIEDMSKSYAYESGQRFCAGCVESGIPLGKATGAR